MTCVSSCQKSQPDNLEYESVKVHSDWFEVSYLGDRIYSIEEGTCHFTEQTVWGIPAHIYKYLDMNLLVFQQ